MVSGFVAFGLSDVGCTSGRGEDRLFGVEAWIIRGKGFGFKLEMEIDLENLIRNQYEFDLKRLKYLGLVEINCLKWVSNINYSFIN